MVADLTAATLAVTGATGFVGQAVLEAASRTGLSVRALARRVPDGPAPNGVDFVRGDLADRTALAALTRGADAVIHIAGLTRTLNNKAFETVNVLGTQTVMEATRAANIGRFVFVSSLAAREPLLSAYGASKARAEALVQASSLDWTIVRPPAVYGPRDAEMFELFRNAARFGVVPLPPGGHTSLIHVDDLARLLIACATNADARQLLEPDDGKPGGYSHVELAQLIGQAVGRRRVLAPQLPARVLRLAARVDRLVRKGNAKLTPDRARYMSHPDWVAHPDHLPLAEVWRPEIGAPDGMANTAAWYRSEGWL